jgi:8-oxo-dGTP pyrophosphatase MutT (NUDIX family)
MSLYARLGRVVYWGIWPGSWLYLRGSQRARLLLVCRDEILVVKGWLGIGRWVLPGGGILKNEDPAAGLLREVYEETGIRLKPGQIRLLAREPYRLHGFKYTCHYFTAEVAARPVHKRGRFEIVEIDWSKRADVSAKTHNPDILRALQLLDTASRL